MGHQCESMTGTDIAKVNIIYIYYIYYIYIYIYNKSLDVGGNARLLRHSVCLHNVRYPHDSPSGTQV